MVELTIRLVASLAVVVGLLLLLARVVGKRFTGHAGAPVQVLHRQQLSRSASVAVVTVGSRVLVLGTTDQQVSLLAELDPDELAGLVAPVARGEVDCIPSGTVYGLAVDASNAAAVERAVVLKGRDASGAALARGNRVWVSM